MTIEAEIQKLTPSALVTMYALDATAIGGELKHFCPMTNKLVQQVTWQGQIYEAYPVDATGFDKSGKGPLPRPTLKVANIGGVIGAMCNATEDLVGAKLTRKRTFARFLDAVNFPGGVNAEADPNIHLPDDVYFINRKVNENPVFVEFELVSGLDVQGVKLPRGVIIQNTCRWGYRSAECGYTGGAKADEHDEPTAILANDRCSKRLVGCEFRFGTYGELPYGGYPGAGLNRG